ELGKKLSKRFNDFQKEYGRPLTLAFEPGKFLVSEAGYFLAKVNVVKQTTSTVFAGIDSGFNHLIRPMLYGSYHHIENISNPKGRQRFYSVVGYICETDTFGTNRMLALILRVKTIIQEKNTLMKSSILSFILLLLATHNRYSQEKNNKELNFKNSIEYSIENSSNCINPIIKKINILLNDGDIDSLSINEYHNCKKTVKAQKVFINE